MADLDGGNGLGRNSLATRHRRKVFLSTYCLNSNESSIESPHGTPPVGRRHSDTLRGSNIRQRFRSEDRVEEKSPCEISPRALITQRRCSLLRMSQAKMEMNQTERNLLLKTCSVFLPDKTREQNKSSKNKCKKSKPTYSIYNSSPKKRAKSLNRKSSNNIKNKNTMKPPVIIVEDIDERDGEKKTSSRRGSKRDCLASLLQKRDSLKTIALKAKDKQSCANRNSSQDMSHIKAKWLLGLSLTMVRGIWLPSIRPVPSVP